MLELTRRMIAVERKVDAQNKILRDFASRFCWYWYSERVRLFAIVSAIHKGSDKANLIVFWDGWSGGNDVKVDVHMYVENPLLEEDEQVTLRVGKWEPMLDLGMIVNELVQKMAAEKLAEEDSEPEPPINAKADTEAAAPA
jgi:hypothetical protein